MPIPLQEFFTQRIMRGTFRHLNNWQIAKMARQVARRAPETHGSPVVFFKASTGIDDLSWNSAFHLLASWGFRLQGVPVVFFACRSGMSRCVLGTNRDHPQKTPPCRSCIYQSSTIYKGADVHWFEFQPDMELSAAIKLMGLDELSCFNWKGIPLGDLCLPGLRWILRRFHLEDNARTRFLLGEYILSARNVAQQFEHFLDQTDPRTVIIFNGQFFPEAAACWISRKRGIRTITHEVGLRSTSAFFTEGEATAYPLHIPAGFDLDAAQNARLDAYLEKRFQGQFSMAGIKFWTQIKGLDDSFLKKAGQFKQIVPVFTNVIFDTSQPHANTIFPDMFDWLDQVLEVIQKHPETLFVIRSHPDEMRLRKESRETVAEWVKTNHVNSMPNVLFIPPNEPLSSYDLIQRSKFVMIYNSTIGLEASILGAAVLTAGRGRFTQVPTVFFPKTVESYRQKMEEFLSIEKIEVPAEFRRNSRRFLYYQIFFSSLPFDDFLIPGIRSTHTRFKSFDPSQLLPENSPTIAAILNGVLASGDFLLAESAIR
jgi:hypothetical protein